MIIEYILILNAFLGYLPQHCVSLTQTVTSFHFVSILFLFHRFLKVVSVLASMSRFLYLIGLQVTRIGLGLPLDYSTPLVDITFSILGVVPLVILGKDLHLITFVFQRFFNTLSVDFERVDQIVHI